MASSWLIWLWSLFCYQSQHPQPYLLTMASFWLIGLELFWTLRWVVWPTYLSPRWNINKNWQNWLNFLIFYLSPSSNAHKLTPRRIQSHKYHCSWPATIIRGELSWAFYPHLPRLLLSFLMIWLVSWMGRVSLLSGFIKQSRTTINNLIVFSHLFFQWQALWWSGLARSGPRDAWCGYWLTNCSPPPTISFSSAMSADNNEFSNNLVGCTLGQKVCGRNWRTLLEPWIIIDQSW